MKTILSLFATLLISFSVFAQETTPQPEPQLPLILGHWVSEYPLYNRDVIIDVGFQFTENTMTLTATCSYRYQPGFLQTSVTAPVAYHQQNIHILEGHQSSTNDGFRYCNAGLDRAVWQYHVNHLGKTILWAQVPYNIRFSLVRVEE